MMVNNSIVLTLRLWELKQAAHAVLTVLYNWYVYLPLLLLFSCFYVTLRNKDIWLEADSAERSVYIHYPYQ